MKEVAIHSIERKRAGALSCKAHVRLLTRILMASRTSVLCIPPHHPKPAVARTAIYVIFLSS